ncbi:MAG: hypothetical protein KBD15_01540 [Candidatus Magasanikbacteria bacterium]|jgi:hypothetical protein|nr:hypothetical protein [Candidatus Magasanikbacteria bacterium]
MTERPLKAGCTCQECFDERERISTHCCNGVLEALIAAGGNAQYMKMLRNILALRQSENRTTYHRRQ